MVALAVVGIALLLTVLIGYLRKTKGYDTAKEPWKNYNDALVAALVNLAKQG